MTVDLTPEMAKAIIDLTSSEIKRSWSQRSLENNKGKTSSFNRDYVELLENIVKTVEYGGVVCCDKHELPLCPKCTDDYKNK